jgi:hypothetical protein
LMSTVFPALAGFSESGCQKDEEPRPAVAWVPEALEGNDVVRSTTASVSTAMMTRRAWSPADELMTPPFFDALVELWSQASTTSEDSEGGCARAAGLYPHGGHRG